MIRNPRRGTDSQEEESKGKFQVHYQEQETQGLFRVFLRGF